MCDGLVLEVAQPGPVTFAVASDQLLQALGGLWEG